MFEHPVEQFVIIGVASWLLGWLTHFLFNLKNVSKKDCEAWKRSCGKDRNNCIDKLDVRMARVERILMAIIRIQNKLCNAQNIDCSGLIDALGEHEE